MKAKNIGEKLIKASYRLPKNILDQLEEMAIGDRRSINDELIYLLEKHIFGGSKMKVSKKGVILIRFPEALADKLRRASLETNTPIKDIVSEIVEKNLDEWQSERPYKNIEEGKRTADT